MENEVKDYFDILLSVCRAEEIPLRARYRQMRELLERMCREQMEDTDLLLADLSARISFVAVKAGLSVAEQNRLHTFRLTSNAVLNRREEPVREKLLRDAKTLAFFIRKIHQTDIPRELYRMLPQADATYIVRPLSSRMTRRMRVCFQYADNDFLYVSPVDAVSDELLRVRYRVPQVNEEFTGTCGLLWRYAQLNLLDVAEDEEGVLTPAFIVFEPDYLLDISSLAECYKEYGHHPANYQLNKLQPIENTRAILLGNIVNLFLDEWIYADGEPDYVACMQKAFRRYPIELAACGDLRDPDEETKFFQDCRRHFEHIRRIVSETFRKPGYKLDKTDAVLEPSYICEALGLQGRLDYMQRDMRSFIEMKSGKADEYALANRIVPKENNSVQMMLYQAVLQYSMGVDHREVTPYLLYTRYPLLYPARASWAMVRRAIDLRNRIVADEYAIQSRNDIRYTADRWKAICPDLLNERKLRSKFWEQYLRPGIERTLRGLAGLSETERAYFYSLYNFIAKEQYIAKSGDLNQEGRTGAAALWLSTLDQKREAGEILYDLVITENKADNESKPYVNLRRKEDLSEPDEEGTVLPNFRQGDAVLLYQRNTAEDNVTNTLVFKGNIEDISEQEITIRLRATQRNLSVLSASSLYAVEHDAMDTAFRTMFLALSSFVFANQERRDLLLGIRPPEFNTLRGEPADQEADDFSRIACKAQAARDYFLLVGPPGTGKTSRALRKMVETFYSEPDTQLLLLAYTNRAVDEICKALKNITPQVGFIRVGSELSCSPSYREYLLENALASCSRRSEVQERISRCRIFVGTVSTLSTRPELFRLKRFDVAIIDEATQILEPQLLGLLCARSEQGDNAIGKFILIGDHKQLPAVVLQSAAQAEVRDETLRSLGMINLKDSLFERMYRNIRQWADPQLITRCVDMLYKQGRMHPAVAHYSNTAFYGGALKSLGLPHQTGELPEVSGEEDHFLPHLSRRVSFLPSVVDEAASSCKVNRSEARIAAALAASVYRQRRPDFDSSRTLGIITPYRSQIALIRREIAGLEIEALNDILIDTVERFQGSERDVIIYSFCVNQTHQLKLLSNIIEEDGVIIDRKLNVAMTRARKQMFVTGVPHLLQLSPVYANLIKLMIKE